MPSGKKKNCDIGKSCGGTCIEQGDMCSLGLPEPVQAPLTNRAFSFQRELGLPTPKTKKEPDTVIQPPSKAKKGTTMLAPPEEETPTVKQPPSQKGPTKLAPPDEGPDTVIQPPSPPKLPLPPPRTTPPKSKKEKLKEKYEAMSDDELISDLNNVKHKWGTDEWKARGNELAKRKIAVDAQGRRRVDIPKDTDFTDLSDKDLLFYKERGETYYSERYDDLRKEIVQRGLHPGGSRAEEARRISREVMEDSFIVGESTASKNRAKLDEIDDDGIPAKVPSPPSGNKSLKDMTNEELLGSISQYDWEEESFLPIGPFATENERARGRLVKELNKRGIDADIYSDGTFDIRGEIPKGINPKDLTDEDLVYYAYTGSSLTKEYKDIKKEMRKRGLNQDKTDEIYNNMDFRAYRPPGRLEVPEGLDKNDPNVDKLTNGYYHRREDRLAEKAKEQGAPSRKENFDNDSDDDLVYFYRYGGRDPKELAEELKNRGLWDDMEEFDARVAKIEESGYKPGDVRRPSAMTNTELRNALRNLDPWSDEAEAISEELKRRGIDPLDAYQGSLGGVRPIDLDADGAGTSARRTPEQIERDRRELERIEKEIEMATRIEEARAQLERAKEIARRRAESIANQAAAGNDTEGGLRRRPTNKEEANAIANKTFFGALREMVSGFIRWLKLNFMEGYRSELERNIVLYEDLSRQLDELEGIYNPPQTEQQG